jgi:hypothetical protein
MTAERVRAFYAAHAEGHRLTEKVMYESLWYPPQWGRPRTWLRWTFVTARYWGIYWRGYWRRSLGRWWVTRWGCSHPLFFRDRPEEGGGCGLCNIGPASNLQLEKEAA